MDFEPARLVGALAHGLGRPVSDATTTAEFPAAGTYRVWVRTKDWVAHWQAPGAPGKFQVLVNGFTGRIAGKYPLSWVKIFLAALAALIVVLIFAYLDK